MFTKSGGNRLFSMSLESLEATNNSQVAKIQYKLGFFDCNESDCQVWIKMNGKWIDVTKLLPTRQLQSLPQFSTEIQYRSTIIQQFDTELWFGLYKTSIHEITWILLSKKLEYVPVACIYFATHSHHRSLRKNV